MNFLVVARSTRNFTSSAYTFIGFIVLVLIYNFIASRSDSKIENNFESFFKKQRDYFKQPKTILQSLDYISLPREVIEFFTTLKSHNDTQSKLISSIIDLLSNQMIRLDSNISNYKLRQMYGDNNITEILKFNSNYTTLVSDIITLANEFIDYDDIDNAIKILELGVSVKTDISENYFLLAKLYHDENKPSKIKELVSIIESNKLISQKKILIKISKYLKYN